MEGSVSVLLVIGSGDQRYREYLLESMASRQRLWLFDAKTPTWQARHLVGWTVVDVFDVDALVAAARHLADATPVVGVVCYDEALILPAAHVREALGLPGMQVETVRRCRDKSRTRATLSRAGVAQPRSVAVASLDEARAEAAAIGYPVVLKPRGLGASLGVVKVGNHAELERAFEAARSATYPGVPTYKRGVLVEDFLDGPEISVDGCVVDGAYEPLFVARKQLGLAPYFEETGHVVSADDELVTDTDLRALLGAAHRALGIHTGITHSEVRLTSRGPRIVEVNGRLGGDLIPYLGWLATGIDPGHVAVDVALGRRPTSRPTCRRSIGIRFFYPPDDCRVLSIHVPSPDPTSGIHQSTALVGPGTELRLPPNGYVSRYAYVICQAADASACAESLEAAAARVELTWEHLPAACRA